jgi:hypothetical protein
MLVSVEHPLVREVGIDHAETGRQIPFDQDRFVEPRCENAVEHDRRNLLLLNANRSNWLTPTELAECVAGTDLLNVWLAPTC